jgi:hypothetical protein
VATSPEAPQNTLTDGTPEVSLIVAVSMTGAGVLAKAIGYTPGRRAELVGTVW